MSAVINLAKARTTESASVKDWRIRNKRARAMRDAARELVAGKGYAIATVTEMRERFGDLVRYREDFAGKNRVWAVLFCEWDKKKPLQFVII